MGNLSLTIGGTERKANVDRDTFRITERGGIATAAFAIVDKARSITVADNAEVIIQEATTRIFAGYVREVNPKAVGRTRIYEVTCQDYNVLLDEDVVTAPANRQVVESDRARVQWLMTTFGTKGITSTTFTQVVLASMPLGDDGLPRQDFGGKTMREALDQIAKISGAAYHVDFNLELHWYPASGESLSAPYHLSDTPNLTTTFPHYDLEAPRNMVDFRNAVFVRGSGIYGWRPNPPPSSATRRAGVLRDDNITSQALLDAAGDAYLAEHALQDNANCITLRAGQRTGMAVQVTSAIHGFSAKSFQVREIETTLINQTTPMYRLTLGSAPVTLAGLIGDTGSPGVGAIDSFINDPGTTEQPVSDLSLGGQNLLPNSSFENAATSGWVVGAQWVFGSPQATNWGTDVARIALSAQTGGNLDSPKIAVARTDDYWLSAWNFVRSRSAGTIIVEALEYSGVAGGTLVATTVVRSVTAADTDWNRVSIRFGPNTAYGRIAFNASTTFVQLRFRISGTATATWDVDAVQIERSSLLTGWGPTPYELVDGSVGTTQIADDSVTTQKVVANAITSGKIAADAVTATQIQANAVTSNKIAAGAIQTTHFAATAAVPEVDNSGSSVVIDPGGIVISNGKLTFADQYGTNVLDGLGFGRAWLDFIGAGGYNASMAIGTTANITAVSEVSGAATPANYIASLSDDVPYWIVQAHTGTFTTGANRTFKRVADANAPGGFVLRWQNGAANPGTFNAGVYQDFPVRPSLRYVIMLIWKQSVALNGRFIGKFSWRDKDHGLIGAVGDPLAATDFVGISGTGFGQSYSPPTGNSPMNAAYLRVHMQASQDQSVAVNHDIAYVAVNPVEMGALRLQALTGQFDVTPTSDDHPVTIGLNSGDNIAIDTNEIMARSNGSTSDLYLNNDGGAIHLGDQIVIYAGGGNMEFNEVTPPSAGAANTARIYADDSAGVTRLRVVFANGTRVTLANS